MCILDITMLILDITAIIMSFCKIFDGENSPSYILVMILAILSLMLLFYSIFLEMT